MRTARLLIILLILASILLDVVACVVAYQGLYNPWRHTLMLGLWHSQVSLMAIWLVWGRQVLSLRLAVAAAVVAAWSCILTPMQARLAPANAAEWLRLPEMGTVLLAQMAIVSLPLLAIQLPKFLRRLRGEMARKGPEDEGRWQFSIAYMLGWMTAISILLAAWKTLELDGPEPLRAFPSGSLAVFVVRRTLIAIAVAWAVTGRMSLIARGAVVPLTVGYLLAMADTQNAPMAGYYGWIATVMFLEATFLAGSLVVLRVGNYQFAPRSASTASTEKAASPPNRPE